MRLLCALFVSICVSVSVASVPTSAVAAAASAGAAAPAAVGDPVATSTTLRLNADGTGDVWVAVADGSDPVNYVDLWVDGRWQRAFTLTDGAAAIDIGPQSIGDHRVTVRYRNSAAHAASQASIMWTAPGTVQVPTTTALKLNADGTGTVKVTANGTTPTNKVDLWVDKIWKAALTLTNGEAAIDIGPQSLGDHRVTARYRPSSITGTSQTTVVWTAPGTVQVPTTTALKLNADGTGTVKVTADGTTPTNKVDLWVDKIWKAALTLTNGEAAIDIGPQSLGDHRVTARYRPSSTTGTSQTTVLWTAPGTVQVPTMTTLKLNADGTGTVKVTANGTTPTNKVDLWVDKIWKAALTLTNGEAAIDIGPQSLGDHPVTARYRPSSTTGTSQTTVLWTAPGTVADPSTDPDPTTTPEPTTEQTTTPEPMPEPTTEPTTMPEPITEPTTMPEPTTEPTTMPEPTTEPTTMPEPTTEPTTMPEPTTEPTTMPEPTTEPTTMPEPTTEPPPEDACGARLPKADGSWWECSFVDDFDGDTLDPSKWLVQETWYSGMTSGNADCYVNDAETIEQSDGVLRLTALREREPFTCHSPFGAFEATSTGATVATRDRFAQTYGRFAFRAKLPDTAGKPGPHSNLWLYPQDHTYGGWPHSGEVDVAEWFSARPDNVYPSVHYNGEDPLDSTGYECSMPTASTEFHTYAIEWKPTEMRFYYDDKLCFTHSWPSIGALAAPQPFDRPFYLVLTQVWGSLWNAPTAETPNRATLQVDWTRVWK